jgi:hypothetical protein
MMGLVKRNTYVKVHITSHSRDMANDKVFADRQTDGRTGQKLYARDLSIQGHKRVLSMQ